MSSTCVGSPDLLIDDFYETLDTNEGWAMKRGQMYWAHVRYSGDWPFILQLDAYDSTNPVQSTFKVKRYSDGDTLGMPLPEIQLSQEELLYVQPGKLRPLIVLDKIRSEWFTNNPSKDEHILFGAPAFTVKPRHTRSDVAQVQSFRVPQWFYLPPDRNHSMEEGIVRFEVCQAVEAKCVRPLTTGRRLPVKLTDDAFALLVNHLACFCGGEGDKTLSDYCREYGSELLGDGAGQ